MKTQFIGTGVAVITPFTESGDVDHKALKELIDYLIANGIDYLVALGTTAESATLSHSEKHAVIKTFIDHVNGRVPIVVGVGGNHTQAVITFINEVSQYPIQGILAVCPYYNKPNQAGLLAHFDAVAKSTELPIILYNVPARTSSNILPETVVNLTKLHSHIVAIKEASGSLAQAMAIVQSTDDDFVVISGEDALTLPLMSIGAKGVISVVGQGYPKQYSKMVNYALSGDFEKAKELHYSLLHVTHLLFQEGNPAGIKSLLSSKGMIQNELRLPLVKATMELQTEIALADQNLS